MNNDERSNNNEFKESENSRQRTTSECSFTSDDGISNFTGKRQRTTSQTFMVASAMTAASPPKFVSLEEIMQAANGMRDMNLVHQIVVDDNFRLEKAEPEMNTVQRVIKETMHKAFYDILREQLQEDPPNYSQALVLLEDIRQGLFALLLPQHTKIKQQISEILDTELIKQQAENGVLDFKHYAQYVISVMSKLCAPVRDEKIKQLTETVDVIDTFRDILETLELMQLDMANFTLQMAKPDIIAQSVELERKKFADYLAVQVDGLQNTRKWLLNHLNTTEAVPNTDEYDKFIKMCLKKAFWNACLDLLDWPLNSPYPETFILDEDRLMDLQNRTFRLVVAATILLVGLSNAGPDLQSIASFKESLKEHICILLKDVKNESQLSVALPNLADQVLNDLKAAQEKFDLPEMYQAAEANLRQQLLDIDKLDHKVKNIIKQRVKDFFLDIIQSSTAAPQKVPSGLSGFQRELAQIAGQFLRIVSHNSTVFSVYYYDIVADALPKPN